MKNKIQEKLKLIKNEKYFDLSYRLNMASSVEELNKISKEIDKEIDIEKKEEYKIRLEDLKYAYYENISSFKPYERKVIEKMFVVDKNVEDLGLILSILESRISIHVKHVFIKKILNERKEMRYKLREIKRLIYIAMPFIDNNKYLEIKNSIMNEDFDNIEKNIEELKLIISKEKLNKDKLLTLKKK